MDWLSAVAGFVAALACIGAAFVLAALFNVAVRRNGGFRLNQRDGGNGPA